MSDVNRSLKFQPEYLSSSGGGEGVRLSPSPPSVAPPPSSTVSSSPRTAASHRSTPRASLTNTTASASPSSVGTAAPSPSAGGTTTAADSPSQDSNSRKVYPMTSRAERASSSYRSLTSPDDVYKAECATRTPSASLPSSAASAASTIPSPSPLKTVGHHQRHGYAACLHPSPSPHFKAHKATRVTPPNPYHGNVLRLPTLTKNATTRRDGNGDDLLLAVQPTMVPWEVYVVLCKQRGVKPNVGLLSYLQTHVSLADYIVDDDADGRADCGVEGGQSIAVSTAAAGPHMFRPLKASVSRGRGFAVGTNTDVAKEETKRSENTTKAKSPEDDHSFTTTRADGSTAMVRSAAADDVTEERQEEANRGEGEAEEAVEALRSKRDDRADQGITLDFSVNYMGPSPFALSPVLSLIRHIPFITRLVLDNNLLTNASVAGMCGALDGTAPWLSQLSIRHNVAVSAGGGGALLAFVTRNASITLCAMEGTAIPMGIRGAIERIISGGGGRGGVVGVAVGSAPPSSALLKRQQTVWDRYCSADARHSLREGNEKREEWMTKKEQGEPQTAVKATLYETSQLNNAAAVESNDGRGGVNTSVPVKDNETHPAPPYAIRSLFPQGLSDLFIAAGIIDTDGGNNGEAKGGADEGDIEEGGAAAAAKVGEASTNAPLSAPSPRGKISHANVAAPHRVVASDSPPQTVSAAVMTPSPPNSANGINAANANARIQVPSLSSTLSSAKAFPCLRTLYEVARGMEF